MPSLHSITSLTAVFLLSFQGAFANPVPSNTSPKLVARIEENYVDCSADQKAKLKRGFGDAAQLARWMYDNMNTDNKAWSHYFRTEGDGKDDDVKNAKAFWSAIASNNDPTNARYRFSVRCGKDSTPDCKGGKSVAITDAKPQENDDTPREMLICPLFFKSDSKETKQDLKDKSFAKPKRGVNSWCSPGNNFPWYEVAGHTLLHEMTHLDAVGQAAGVTPRDEDDADGFKTHGTDDVGGLGNSYPVAARKLAELWQKGSAPDKALKPWQNAENLAGSALEFYMTDRCKKEGDTDIGEIKL